MADREQTSTRTPSRVRVVVVAYHSADDLEGCLATLPAGVPVVVIDNASPDESAAVAERCGAQVVRNPENDGFGRAVHLAMRSIDEEFVLLLNPDARLEDSTLTTLLAAMDDPRVAMAGPRYVTPEGDADERPWWPLPGPARAWAEAIGAHRLMREEGPGPHGEVGFVIGACALLRRAAYEDVGGFDPRYWLYGEETDLSARLQRAGWKVVYVPDARAVHLRGRSGRDSSALVRDHFDRGSERFVLLHRGAAGLVSFRAALMVGSTLRVATSRDPSVRRFHLDRLRRLGRAFAHHPSSLPHVDDDQAIPGLVVASLEPWDEIWRRNQFFVRELLALDPRLAVLFVEPPLDVLHDLRRTKRWPALPSRRPVALPNDPHVLTFRPVKWLPRVVWPWADRALSRQVHRAVRHAELGATTLWINSIGFADLAVHSSWPVVYDLTDDWLLADDTPRRRALTAAAEEALMTVADEVVVCSAGLETTKSDRRRVRLVPNAVDVDHVRRPQARPTDLPAAPVVLYVGTVHPERVDLALVRAAAEALRHVSFVLVGPQVLDDADRAMLDRPNISLLGPRPYAEVPGYLQHADVLMVPHVVSPFTDSLDPIKAYEFAAAGRPVIATPVAGFRDHPELAHVAPRASFVSDLASMLRSDAQAAGTGVVPSWRERTAEFAEALRAASDPGEPTHQAPLRIVFVGHGAKLSGGEIALLRLLPVLHHVEPHVVLGEDGPLVDALRDANIGVDVLEMPGVAREVRRNSVGLSLAPIVATIRYALDLRTRLRELDADLVVTNTLKASLYGAAAARLAGIPVVWHLRDRIADDYLPRPVVVAIRALARVLPNGVVANSASTLATLGRPSRRRPWFAVHDSVELSATPAETRAEVRRVGIVGRISQWKGQDVFLRAFALGFPDGDVEAVVIGSPMFGEDDFEAELHRLADELGLTGRVDFRGFRSDVEAEMARLDVVVHASVVPEPFGQVIIEAMAVGVPVVAADSGGPREIVTHGTDGLLTPPGDVTALAAALRRLADDHLLRIELAKRGRERAAQFDGARAGIRVERAYRRIHTAARRPTPQARPS